MAEAEVILAQHTESNMEKIISSIDECKDLWNKTVIPKCLFDLWEVRSCFQKHFNRKPHFIVLEEDEIKGLLPLSYIEETDSYAFFPGETHKNKTWLEQNRIYAKDIDSYKLLISSKPNNSHIRYLVPDILEYTQDVPVDEIKYFFYPSKYSYSIDNYWQEFSGKSRKKLKEEMDRIRSLGIEWRINDLDDVEKFISMNIKSFGENSYYSGYKFRNSFLDLIKFLRDNDYLRIVTAIVNKELAAIDIGVVYNKIYTLLAGGTNPDFLGIAKIINLNHMEWACENKIDSVDFLCGDFGWKERFHLDAVPLYHY